MAKKLTLDVTSFKFEDNETDLKFRAIQNGLIISDSTLSATIKIKQADVGYIKSVSAEWVDKYIVISSGDLSDLPVGSYLLELWLGSASGYEIYPDSGFVRLYINQNATGISGNLISSITLGEFQQQFNDLAKEVNNKIDDLHAQTDSNTSNIELKANLADITSLQNAITNLKNEVEAFGITNENLVTKESLLDTIESNAIDSEKLLNKRLTGYVVTTGKVGFENNSSYMTFKIINVPNQGTLTLPKSSITSSQLFVLEDSNQVCFNHIEYYKKESWFNVSETSMTINFAELIRIYPRTVTLYVGFTKADGDNFFSEAKNIAQLSDVFKWAEEPNQDILTEYNFNLPPYVPLVAGKESYIYFDNILIDKNFYAQSIPAIARNQREDKVVLSGISNYTQSINIGGVPRNIPIKSISENAGAGKNLKVMVIGESTSEDGRFMTNIKNFFDLDIVNIDFIGTRTSGGVKHEARAGWGSGTLRYISEANNATNSFWNPDTQGFDLDYYFSQHSDVPIPDVILLNFGINEVNRFVTDGRSGTQSEHYNFFINEFKKKNPNLISIVGLSHSFARWTNYWIEPERDNIMKRTKQTIKDFKDRESEKIFLNPWYVCLDMRWDFQYLEVKKNQFSDKTSIVGTDSVHPSESGYKNMALMSYFAIKYALSIQ